MFLSTFFLTSNVIRLISHSFAYAVVTACSISDRIRCAKSIYLLDKSASDYIIIPVIIEFSGEFSLNARNRRVDSIVEVVSISYVYCVNLPEAYQQVS